MTYPRTSLRPAFDGRGGGTPKQSKNTGLVSLYEHVELMVNELYHRCRDWPVFLSFMLNMVYLAMRGSNTVPREQAYSLVGYVVHTYLWQPVLSNWHKGNWDFGLPNTERNQKNVDMVCLLSLFLFFFSSSSLSFFLFSLFYNILIAFCNKMT